MTTHAVLKDPELREYYEALFEMYTSLGWRKLMEDVAYVEATKASFDDVNTVEELHFRKGLLDQLRWLRDHQPRTEYVYRELLAKQEGTLDAEVFDPAGGAAKVIS